MKSTYAYKCGDKQPNLLKQVYEQGVKLRSSIVDSILQHDPFYFVNAKTENAKASANTTNNISLSDKHKCLAYLKGEPFSIDDEKQVLDTFRALSTSDICDLTSRSFKMTQDNCRCSTCKIYHKTTFNMAKVPSFNLKLSSNKSSSRNSILEYVNSLKVLLFKFTLSKEGLTKLNHVLKQKYKRNEYINHSINITYFIEYEIPMQIRKSGQRKSKVDTGLHTSDLVKTCSKKILDNVIIFEHTIIHDVANVIELDDILMNFKISFRIIGQKQPNILGFGSIDFSDFYQAPSLSYTQQVPIFLNRDSPIVVGNLKLGLQLGCDKLYFGAEFLESIKTSKETCTVRTLTPDNLDATFVLSETPQKLVECAKKQFIVSKLNTPKTDDALKQKPPTVKLKPAVKIQETLPEISKPIDEKPLLFGFVFISEVNYLNYRQQTYCTLQPFCQNEFAYSNVEKGGIKPQFNFHQTIPYIYEEEFLFKLRDNFMIIEFFEKCTEEYNYGDKVFGIAKIPLHQYYLAYRNPRIVEYLSRNSLPVIGTDWYEQIKHPFNDEIVGSVQILVALGTERQIHGLQKERGFMDDIVVRNSNTVKQPPKTTPRFVQLEDIRHQPSLIAKQTQTETPRLQKIDRSTSITPVHTEVVKNKQPKMERSDNVDTKLESIQNYLQQLIAMTTHGVAVPVEKPTDIGSADGEKRSTSELLDTLQHAMADSRKDTFKAQIVVDCALHLPVRKKFRIKKVKGKVVREELLPSTYVSYQIKENVIKTTQVIQKSTNPVWNIRNDVTLSLDFLTNKNKPLIFKVWKKSNNGSTIPNMQIDTIIGIATVDLTVLSAGLSTIEGWFSIKDFNDKSNGEIKINIFPMENLKKYAKECPMVKELSSTPADVKQTDELLSLEENDETLGRALKRKLIELDEIHRRLKTRLNDITEDTIVEDDSDTINDQIADEFEKDINTLVVEEDYDLLDFAKEAQDLTMHRVSNSLHKWQETIGEVTLSSNTETSSPSPSVLQFASNAQENYSKTQASNDTSSEISEHLCTDSLNDSLKSSGQQLVVDKERIDDLLQKLTLISKTDSEIFSNRHVSGCSTSQENNTVQVACNLLTTGVLNDIDINDLNLLKLVGNQLPHKVRDEPDGEGNISSDDKQNDN